MPQILVRFHVTFGELIVCAVGIVVLLPAVGCSVPAWLPPAVDVAAAATAKVGTNDPIKHRVDAQLRVSDSQLDFGTIDVTARALRQLEVRNISRFDLKLLAARSTGPCFTVVATTPFPITLAPDEAITLAVAMSNKAETRCDSRLEISTDSAAAALVAIRLKGRVGSSTSAAGPRRTAS